MSESFDLLVIGSGPAGQKGAIAAAKLGKRVALVDRRTMIGGVSLHGGTIPSKTLREAILFLTGFRQRPFYGSDFTVKERINSEDLRQRVRMVVERETGVVRAQLKRNDVVLVDGLARFADPHTIEVETDSERLHLQGEHILVACGTRPARSAGIPFDGERIIDTSELGRLPELPREVLVVGAGVIGLEYASMFTALGMDVAIVDCKPEILEFVDGEIVERLVHHMRERGAVFRLGETVASVQKDAQGRVEARLESGKTLRGDVLLYAVGRQPNTDTLSLGAAGVEVDRRGRIPVNEHFQTAVPHIYAAGDVVGFPALAATSMQQGRLAAAHMFGVEPLQSGQLLPLGIYTVPEISMVGKTEQELTAARVPYEFGISRYEELAKGQIVGDRHGTLKILFDPSTLQVLGVHVLGEGATELVHIGQAVMCLGGSLNYFRDNVFNYPTFAEAYKVAALDGLNKVRR